MPATSPTAMSACRGSSSTANITSRWLMSNALRQMYDLFESRGRSLPGAGPGAAGARLRAQMLAHFQRAGCARRGRRHRAAGVLRPHARTGPPRGGEPTWSSARDWNIPGLKDTGEERVKGKGQGASRPYPPSPMPWSQSFPARNRHGRAARRRSGCGARAAQLASCRPCWTICAWLTVRCASWAPRAGWWSHVETCRTAPARP